LFPAGGTKVVTTTQTYELIARTKANATELRYGTGCGRRRLAFDLLLKGIQHMGTLKEVLRIALEIIFEQALFVPFEVI